MTKYPMPKIGPRRDGTTNDEWPLTFPIPDLRFPVAAANDDRPMTD